MKKESTSSSTDDPSLALVRLIIGVIVAAGMFIFMRTTGYDPFPMCTCGELSTDSALINSAAQGDTLIQEYLATESSDLMCAARKKALLEKLEQRAKHQQPVDN